MVRKFEVLGGAQDRQFVFGQLETSERPQASNGFICSSAETANNAFAPGQRGPDVATADRADREDGRVGLVGWHKDFHAEYRKDLLRMAQISTGKSWLRLVRTSLTGAQRELLKAGSLLAGAWATHEIDCLTIKWAAYIIHIAVPNILQRTHLASPCTGFKLKRRMRRNR